MSESFDILDNSELLDILKGEGIEEEESKKSQVLEITNEGSGDLSEDLENWFGGNDVVPSEPLKDFTSSTALKTDLGIKMSTLQNFSLMRKLKKFLEDSFETCFDVNTLISLEPNELNSKIKLAFDMYKDVYLMNQRTLQIMRDMKVKGVENDELDEMKVLLSSIPDSKLKKTLQDLNDSSKK